MVAIRVDVGGGFIVRPPLGPRRGGEAAAPCMSAVQYVASRLSRCLLGVGVVRSLVCMFWNRSV